MTRASLLQLLTHPSTLNGADTRALEQLAEAFPYCQTAHLLLAKAAHDQSSMLAGQRLRRAATYAADRTHLRQLIEQPAPSIAVAEPALAEIQAPLAMPERVAAAPAPEEAPVLTLTAPENETLTGQPLLVAAPTDQPDQVIGEVAPAALPEVIAAELLPEAEEELPAQAPPIRPPAGAQVARYEFGLADEEPAELLAYRLPDPVEPAGISAAATVAATPALPAYSGVPDVGYAPTEGSQLGFCLVAPLPTDLLPSASLPPTGEFFEPDGLLLAHLAAHQLPTLPKPSSLDLINSFLQRAPAPQRRRVAPLPSAPEPDAQADLSVRSTRAEPDLASESLAKILARQGKNDRAIAVYERLMVKHPEKMAYFAAQIESLRPSA
ncbi:hypothetical protein [Hymenobacter sp. BRD67]|uniref:hypothetical protein n=1 Tax=Hymenobacter sp. BRD67 TaxID=2675877 RepID=UPI00156759B1|nr:hypothetical protein [Hymenobacter sp. BRD67]QKG52336.1 hypothetical protein GKZ67_06555 [Hymenobacter sp. BRD67]